MINEIFGWLWILIGFVSGMLIGMRFHDEKWLGGYGSHQRRLVRLGHIAFLGLGIINILFVVSLPRINLGQFLFNSVSNAFIIGAITMPLCCFLLAWQKKYLFLFAIPVLSLIYAVLMTIGGLYRP